MMRHAFAALGRLASRSGPARFGLIGAALGIACALAPPARAGYYCSPGFEATYGGRCVATISRDEIDLYLNEPASEPIRPIRPLHRIHRHHPRHGLAERY